MDAQTFFRRVGEMMQAQTDYFRDRTRSQLVEAKRLEKEIKQVLAEGLEDVPSTLPAGVYVEKQPGLFE